MKNSTTRQRALELIRGGGRTREEVRGQLRREGHPTVAAGTLSCWAEAAGLAFLKSGRRPGKALPVSDERIPDLARPEASTDEPAAEPALPGDELVELVPTLRRMIKSSLRLVERLERDGDPGAALRAGEQLTKCAGILARVAPPPKVNPEEMPDMVAAAARCRAKLHEVLDRLMEAK